ncbi:MAG: STAS domain-containing protein [Candidatus Eremiobacteraeota bacterium]|nr:STAS domain-containing protein [Candidatus Eremiobacteraeota bacterium]
MADDFAVVKLPECDVLHVLRDLDIATVGAFSEAIRGLASEGRPVIVDFSKCAYMDSTGLRIVATEYANLPRGSRIIVPEGGTVRRLFVITGFDVALAPASTLDLALREAGTANEPKPYG